MSRLYSDEGFDSTKSVYTAKLKELTDLGEPVERRLYETINRTEAASELQKVIDSYIKFANSSDEAYVHIDPQVSFLFCFTPIQVLVVRGFFRRSAVEGKGRKDIAFQPLWKSGVNHCVYFYDHCRKRGFDHGIMSGRVGFFSSAKGVVEDVSRKEKGNGTACYKRV